MNSLLPVILPIAAIGYSLLYLLCGGGFVGAVVIFVIAKFFGK
jgi:ABC-type molybdate transport system permease subunit